MRGVNFGGWFSQIDCIQEKDPDRFRGIPEHLATFLGAKDFARVASWGFDHVRLPVDYFHLFEEATMAPKEGPLRMLDTAVEGLTRHGLQVIVDLHKCPGHDFLDGGSRAQAFFSEPSMRDQAKKVWAHLAERYGANPRVLLEILNEPIAEDSQHWNDVKDEMARLLRKYAPRSTLVVGSNRWNHPSEFARLTPVDDDNVVYSFHFYASLLFTHQHAPWLAGDAFRISRPYPGEYEMPTAGIRERFPIDPGRWDRARMEVHIQDVLQFRDRHRVPVACNEFGVYVGGADRGSQLRWIDDLLSTFDEHGIGWSYWNYKNLDFGIVSDGESLFAGFEQYANPDRVDLGLVETLRSHKGLLSFHP